jgi:adenine/guanine phosphoribosyltransferase-like PRPP-binding protein
MAKPVMTLIQKNAAMMELEKHVPKRRSAVRIMQPTQQPAATLPSVKVAWMEAVKFVAASRTLPATTAIAVAHRMDAALVVVRRFLIIQPVVQTQVFLTPVMPMIVVGEGAVMIKVNVTTTLRQQC